jgi:hypothetical protein
MDIPQRVVATTGGIGKIGSAVADCDVVDGSSAEKCCSSFPCRSNIPKPSPFSDFVVVIILL